MNDPAPAAGGARRSAGGFALEPIEYASVDELRALQLERLRSSLRHAFDNVAHYREAFEAAIDRAVVTWAFRVLTSFWSALTCLASDFTVGPAAVAGDATDRATSKISAVAKTRLMLGTS